MSNKFFELLAQDSLFDSHTHINMKDFDFDREDAVKRAEEKGLIGIIDVGTDLESSKRSLEFSNEFSTVFATAGIHPEAASNLEINIDEEFTKIRELVVNNIDKIAMIGETGLDYFWVIRDVELLKNKDEIIKREQELFRKHLELAQELNLPLTIHTRGAIDDCIKIVSEYKVKGVFHSLTMNEGDGYGIFYDQVKKIQELGFLIGINGIYTFQGAQNERDVFMSIFKEKGINKENFSPKALYDAGFVLETDAPYLVPKQYKVHTARRNEPESIERIYEYIRLQFQS